MKKYIRAEYFDKNGDTAFQNIYIADIKDRTWYEIFTCIEQRYFKGTDNFLIGLLNFRNITDWKQFNSMKEDDIQQWIDNKNVDFIFCFPKGYTIPEDVEIFGMDKNLYNINVI